MANQHIHIIPDHLNLMDFEDDEMQAAMYKALVDAMNSSNNTDHVIAEDSVTPSLQKGKGKKTTKK